MKLTDDRDLRGHPRGRLVDRRQVMQVEEVERPGARAAQRFAPSPDLQLELEIVETGEHSVWGVRAILVGRMHRGPSLAAESKGMGVAKGIGEIHDLDIEVAIERVRVGAGAQIAARAADDRLLPAVI